MGELRYLSRRIFCANLIFANNKEGQGVSSMTSTKVRLWTVDEYHQMIEAEILTSADKVELLEGQIIQMSPQRPPHAATTQCASDYLRDLLSLRATIRVQLPITLPPNSEPEPDIVVVRIDSQKYFDHHPAPDEIFLLVEVAKTTLKSDRTIKVPTYAKANIPEYWILDVEERIVNIFREPLGETYQQEIILNEDTTISTVAFPDVNIYFKNLFP